MAMDSIDNNQLQNESLETKINTLFSNIEFSENQKTRIIECINKFNEQNNENSEEENTQTALRKLKRYLKKGDAETAISLFENELNINNNLIEWNNNQEKKEGNTPEENTPDQRKVIEQLKDQEKEGTSLKNVEIRKKALEDAYSAVDDKYKFSPNQEQERKSKIESLSPTVKSKLKEANVSEEQYADYLLTRDRIPLSDTSSIISFRLIFFILWTPLSITFYYS